MAEVDSAAAVWWVFGEVSRPGRASVRRRPRAGGSLRRGPARPPAGLRPPGLRSLTTSPQSTGIALGVGGLAGGYTGARIQPHLPEVLIRRLLGIFVVVIGARYLWLGLH